MQLSGNILDYLIAFGSGIAVSFTPCVYPVMPITASFIAGMNAKGSKLRGFVLSLLYVFGIALTYCGLAVLAALSGKVFGQIQNHPAVYVVVGIIFTGFALVMFDLLLLPNFAINVGQRIKRRNVGTVILFGMAAGLVVGPCTAPILGTLLLYVASKQNVLHGISLLFVFSYGVGASLILVGTFSGILGSLPKSGKWMVRVKQLCGLIFLGLAGYYFYKAGSFWL